MYLAKFDDIKNNKVEFFKQAPFHMVGISGDFK
jgi:hypothetical protein